MLESSLQGLKGAMRGSQQHSQCMFMGVFHMQLLSLVLMEDKEYHIIVRIYKIASSF